MHRVFPPALVAAIRDARVPQATDVQALAAKMWLEAFPACAPRNWHDISHGSAQHQRMLRAAEIALYGEAAPPLSLAA